MNLISGKETNWKFISIVLALAILIGGGTLWFLQKQIPSYQPLVIKIPENEEIKKVNYIYIHSEKKDENTILTFNINFQDYIVKEEKELPYPWKEYPELMGTEHVIPSNFNIIQKPLFVEIERNGIGSACLPEVPSIDVRINYPINSSVSFELIDKKEEKIEENINMILNCTYGREYCGPCLEPDLEDKLYPENPIWYSYNGENSYFAGVALIRYNPITKESYILKEIRLKAMISSK